MDILKRSLAPITQSAWQEIDNQAKIILASHLSARKFVDVEGPKGWDYAAVQLGRLDVPKKQDYEGVDYGVHRILPLVETRSFFELDLWELDNIERGAEDIDLAAMEKAAKNIALFEERAIYLGFKSGKIQGIKDVSPHQPLQYSGKAEDILTTVSNGLALFADASISGPYALIINPQIWKSIYAYIKGYPLKNQLERILGGPVIINPSTDDSFLVSMRGGDLKLVLGQDLSIGFHSHDQKKVRLYFTESFTFYSVDPAVVLNIQTK
ncbi:bacteriocin family protein [candidate division KSB1 bacterium]|nr:bacteriocin family protein [candidate division KSB1 bacterium]